MLKSILVAAFSCLLLHPVMAQLKLPDLDKSPMDMSYWPDKYPVLKLQGKTKEQPIARVIYGRPQKKQRIIFDSIVKYNEIWRLGANEATEIEFFKNVKIAGRVVPKGRYTLYCIPTPNKWTLIFNKDNYSWGNYSYDIKKDLLRTEANVEKPSTPVEVFTLQFEETKEGAKLNMYWDEVKVSLPIQL